MRYNKLKKILFSLTSKESFKKFKYSEAAENSRPAGAEVEQPPVIFK